MVTGSNDARKKINKECVKDDKIQCKKIIILNRIQNPNSRNLFVSNDDTLDLLLD